MWLFAIYDLPVTEEEMKREYTHFHKYLLSVGFSMIQYSVYARFCGSEEYLNQIRGAIKRNLPEYGQVRILKMTDKQFLNQEVFQGKNKKKPEKKPEQLSFF